MTQDERSQRSRCKILDCALAEFAAQGYGGGTVNGICRRGQIAKGVLYHYFSDKDALYLACVGTCFDALRSFLQEQLTGGPATLEQYFDARLAFFQARPQEQRLFYDAVIVPPPHLKAQIIKRKAELDELNLLMLSDLLAAQRLRPDVTLSEAIEVFRLYQDFVITSFAAASETAAQVQYDRACRRAVDWFLYGLVARD